jgi:hypothetical protein
MKQARFVVVLLTTVIGSANLLHAQKSVPKSGPVVSVSGVSRETSEGAKLAQLVHEPSNWTWNPTIE